MFEQSKPFEIKDIDKITKHLESKGYEKEEKIIIPTYPSINMFDYLKMRGVNKL